MVSSTSPCPINIYMQLYMVVFIPVHNTEIYSNDFNDKIKLMLRLIFIAIQDAV